MPSKVIELLQPWTAENGQSYPEGSTVQVEEDVAQDLITRGIGVTSHFDGQDRGPTSHYAPPGEEAAGE